MRAANPPQSSSLAAHTIPSAGFEAAAGTLANRLSKHSSRRCNALGAAAVAGPCQEDTGVAKAAAAMAVGLEAERVVQEEERR